MIIVDVFKLEIGMTSGPGSMNVNNDYPPASPLAGWSAYEDLEDLTRPPQGRILNGGEAAGGDEAKSVTLNPQIVNSSGSTGLNGAEVQRPGQS